MTLLAHRDLSRALRFAWSMWIFAGVLGCHPSSQRDAAPSAEVGVTDAEANSTIVQELASQEGEDWTIRSLVFSPDSKNLAIGSANQHQLTSDVPLPGMEAASSGKLGTLFLVDVNTGQRTRTIEYDGDPVLSVAYSPDGTTLATAHADGTIRLCDLQAGSAKATLTAAGLRNRVCHCVAFSPDGTVLAAAFGGNTKVNEVGVWDLRGKSDPRVLNAYGGNCQVVGFSPDGKILAAGDESPSPHVTLWQTDSWKELGSLGATQPDQDRFSEAVGEQQGGYQGAPKSLSTAVRTLAFSPKGHALVAGVETVLPAESDPTLFVVEIGELVLWDTETRKVEVRVRAHDDQITAVAYSPDGKLLASASWDRTVKLWSTKTWKCLATLKGHRLKTLCVAFSPDGKTLASGAAEGEVYGDHGELKLWDVSKIGMDADSK